MSDDANPMTAQQAELAAISTAISNALHNRVPDSRNRVVILALAFSEACLETANDAFSQMSLADQVKRAREMWDVARPDFAFTEAVMAEMIRTRAQACETLRQGEPLH